jgi:hypothetical protein
MSEFPTASLNACSQRCEATPTCKAFGFLADAFPASWGSCQLFDACVGQFPALTGYVFFVKGGMDALPTLTIANRRRNAPVEPDAGRPISESATNSSNPGNSSSDGQPRRSPITPAGWPTQLGLPLGQVIDPSLPPDEASAPESSSSPLVLARSALAQFGLFGDPSTPRAILGYPCDDNEGEPIMQIDGDWTGSCSQLCLPPELAQLALKTGYAVRGRCTALCTRYVCARKYMDMVYHVYDQCTVVG